MGEIKFGEIELGVRSEEINRRARPSAELLGAEWQGTQR